MIPEEHRWLYWDVDPASIDLERHRDYVIERAMGRGNWTAMQWLIRTYSTVELGDFLDRKGERLPPRERAFWALVTGRPRVSVPGGGKPLWAR